MVTTCILAVSRRLLIAAVVLTAGSAQAQPQSGDQQQCVNAINKDIAKVAAAQGKINSGCVKAAAKAPAAGGCLFADPKAKVAKARSKTQADELERCAVAPDFGFTDSTTANDAAEQMEVDLIAQLFGSTDLPSVIVPATPVGACQAAVSAALEKVVAAAFKAYNDCKKDRLRDAVAAGDLEACVTPDGIAAALASPGGKVGKAAAKLASKASQACASVDVSTTFPGACSGASPFDLADCLSNRLRCRLCAAINAADGLNADCDGFDDGAVNDSCGGAGGVHACVLGPGSTLRFNVVAVPVPLTFGLSGAIDVSISPTAVSCAVQHVDPVTIPAIGVVCIEPGGPCPTGSRDCDGGDPLGVAVLGNGTAGSCGGNASCDTTCNILCGGPVNVLASNCTGFCSGPTPQVCTLDSQCAPTNGSCNGPDALLPTQANLCQCTCVNTATHGPSAPGDLQCSLGARPTVEAAAPCDGTDVVLATPDVCIPISTQRATGTVINANFGANTLPLTPGANDLTGTTLSCPALDAGPTAGMQLVGTFSIFGSAFGDIAAGVTAVCQ
jgi:hypothetical protein